MIHFTEPVTIASSRGSLAGMAADYVGSAVQRDVIAAVARTLDKSLKGKAEQKFTAPPEALAFGTGYAGRADQWPQSTDRGDGNGSTNGNGNGNGNGQTKPTPTPTATPGADPGTNGGNNRKQR